MTKKYSVFVSSTYLDLMEERKTVMETMLHMGCIPEGMEYFNASCTSQWDRITNTIDQCDYYVLIVAGRYGSEFGDTGKSYTQMEYEYAVSKNIPVLSFIIKDTAHLPASFVEQNPEKIEKLNKFKTDLLSRQCSYWDNAENLATSVALSLIKAQSHSPRPGWIRVNN